jgi:tagaturonate reductase
VPYDLPQSEAVSFGRQVLDRFRNPHIQHQWLSISMQYTSKMAMRVVPVLLRYVERFKKVPEHIALGFAAYLLFMKAVKTEQGTWWGEYKAQLYPINDAQAEYYFNLWQLGSAKHVVSKALRNETLWKVDLSQVAGFETSVLQKMEALSEYGAMQTMAQMTQPLER